MSSEDCGHQCFPPSLPTSAQSSQVVVKMMTMGFGVTDKPLHRNSWLDEVVFIQQHCGQKPPCEGQWAC